MHWLVGIPALIFALYFAGCEVYGTFEFLHADQGGWTYIVAAGCGIASALAVLPAFAAFAWRNRKDLSIALWTLFAAALVVVVAAGVARTGSATDTAQSERTKGVLDLADNRKAVTLAEDEVSKADVAVAEARAALAKASPLRTCTKTCIDSLTANVLSAQDDAYKARARLDAARAAVTNAAPPRKDSISARLAAVMPWVSEDSVRLYQPIAVPVLTSALSAALMSLAVWCFGPYRIRRIALAQAAADLEEPPQQLEAEDVDELDDDETAPKRLALVGPGSALAEFAADYIERAEGSELSMREVLATYEEACRREDVQPLDRSSFARELAALCKLTGIFVRVDGKDAYLVDARLAA